MTDEQMIDNLRAGLEAARKLSGATDALTETLGQIERTLSEMRFGVEASTPMGQGERLVFRRKGKTWRLLIEVEGVEVSEGDRNLLINSSREHRLASVSYLPSLFTELAQQASHKVEGVCHANLHAESLLTTLRTLLKEQTP